MRRPSRPAWATGPAASRAHRRTSRLMDPLQLLDPIPIVGHHLRRVGANAPDLEAPNVGCVERGAQLAASNAQALIQAIRDVLVLEPAFDCWRPVCSRRAPSTSGSRPADLDDDGGGAAFRRRDPDRVRRPRRRRGDPQRRRVTTKIWDCETCDRRSLRRRSDPLLAERQAPDEDGAVRLGLDGGRVRSAARMARAASSSVASGSSMWASAAPISIALYGMSGTPLEARRSLRNSTTGILLAYA